MWHYTVYHMLLLMMRLTHQQFGHEDLPFLFMHTSTLHRWRSKRSIITGRLANVAALQEFPADQRNYLKVQAKQLQCCLLDGKLKYAM